LQKAVFSSGAIALVIRLRFTQVLIQNEQLSWGAF
jgi:hypothetical protein